MKAPAAIVLDIEGTTTPISFVYDTLFPYARVHVARFLRERQHDPEVQADITALAEQAARDVQDEVPGASALDPGDIDAVIDNVGWQMDSDRKTTALKSLQGKVWRAGYDSGSLRGDVFPDVPAAMSAWSQAGKTIAIYSSGSIEAQKLLFRHSVAGDLTNLIADYFDTTTGPKREPASYAAIAASLGFPPGEIVFATDILEEAQAASAAGLQVVIMARPGNHPQADHEFPVLDSFEKLR